MSDAPDTGLQPDRFEQGPALIVAGFGERYTLETNSGIAALWKDFQPYLGKVPGQVGHESYGVCCNPDGEGGFEYIAGVQVETEKGLPDEFRWIKLAPRRYAVFKHEGHISGIGQTFQSIWNDWLPNSGLQVAEAPEFERYSSDYDPLTDTGVLEVWLPLKG
ncbi:MAG: GyrI-like domain-containing protein [Pseudomonas sp.]|uniref:GyrI-like domain-containing protein n=1 Tax=Pseudomonas abieticivorans TaxID=2931382 RepID=UPI0020C0BAD6|nr:GyrI-like domain-containing protein [Pseudomonas sp. PIA16]MDE1169035.1 GyrI-like domain-containing protein [Pseudomonas sp.]